MPCTFELELPMAAFVGSSIFSLDAGRMLRPGNPTTGGREAELSTGLSVDVDEPVPEDALSTAVLTD
jgi:hypothetical protein